MIIGLPAGSGNLSSGYDDGVLSTPGGRYAGALAPASSLPPPGDLSSRPAFSRHHVLPWVWFRDCRDVVSPVQVRVAVSCPSSRLPRPSTSTVSTALLVPRLSRIARPVAGIEDETVRRERANGQKGVRITGKRGREEKKEGRVGRAARRSIDSSRASRLRACVHVYSRSALLQVREFRGVRFTRERNRYGIGE